MANSLVDDKKRLQDVIKKLKLDPAPTMKKGRMIADAASADRIVNVLRTVDETLLPRRLTFADDAGQTLKCEVAERRLMRFHTEEPLLSKDEAAEAAARIEAFCSEAAVIHVRSEIICNAANPGETGISMLDLLGHMNHSSIRPDHAALLASAVAQSESYALAVVERQADGSRTERGQSALCEGLRRMDDAEDLPSGNRDDHAVAWQIWLAEPEHGFAVLRAVSPDRCIWMAFEVDHLDAVVESWSRLA